MSGWKHGQCEDVLKFCGFEKHRQNTKSEENGVLVHLMAPHSYCKLLWEMQLESLSKRRKDMLPCLWSPSFHTELFLRQIHSNRSALEFF